MDLSLTEEQEMLKKVARDFLTDKCPKSLVREMEVDVRGYSVQLWQEMAELGWIGIAFPENYGGGGGDFLDLVILLDEMGRVCLPGPFSTVVLSGFAIMEAGTEVQKQQFLPKITQGKLIPTLALTEASGSYELESIATKAVADKVGFVITGNKRFVPDAHIADYIILVTRTKDSTSKEDGITLFIIEAKSKGIVCNPLKTLAGDKQFEMVFNEVRVSEEHILGGLHSGGAIVENVLRRATVAKCAEMVGGAQQVLEMSVAYAKEREQFGHPIGFFQAVQHHCANMKIAVDTSKFLTYQAAWMLSKDLKCNKEVAIAKAWVSNAYRQVTTLGHQVHAGYGLVTEHDLPLYSRRARAAEMLLGDADFHIDIVARELGL